MAISRTAIVLQQKEKEWTQLIANGEINPLSRVPEASTTYQLLLPTDPHQLHANRQKILQYLGREEEKAIDRNSQ